METTHATCTLCPYLHLPALWCAQASLLSGLHHVRVVMRTFIDAKRASVSSLSWATWTMRDGVGKLWLDCVMDRGRGTMTFFLVNWQFSWCQETSDKERQMLLMKLLLMLQGQRQPSVPVSVFAMCMVRPDIVWLFILQIFVIISIHVANFKFQYGSFLSHMQLDTHASRLFSPAYTLMPSCSSQPGSGWHHKSGCRFHSRPSVSGARVSSLLLGGHWKVILV